MKQQPSIALSGIVSDRKHIRLNPPVKAGNKIHELH